MMRLALDGYRLSGTSCEWPSSPVMIHVCAEEGAEGLRRRTWWLSHRQHMQHAPDEVGVGVHTYTYIHTYIHTSIR